jgi:hypothetical protein
VPGQRKFSKSYGFSACTCRRPRCCIADNLWPNAPNSAVNHYPAVAHGFIGRFVPRLASTDVCSRGCARWETLVHEVLGKLRDKLISLWHATELVPCFRVQHRFAPRDLRGNSCRIFLTTRSVAGGR